MPTFAGSRLRFAAAAGLLVLLLGFNAIAGASAPGDVVSRTGAVLGQTGFAYLGGLRKFAAAVLWNRIDPIYHSYYNDTPLTEQSYLLPTMYFVTTLDPQFEQAYYLSSWVIRDRRGDREGIAIARDGLANNPRSGLMHANLLQLLFLSDPRGDSPEIAELADAILSSDVVWADEEERFEGLAIARDALSALGDHEAAERVSEELERMKAAGIGLGDHDHDGDGHQDH